nr:MAG TPA: Homeobox-cysteine loop-homeobox [Caudoviricetes sp.]DAX37359.1 MAG TPA: Homeobox-cysteine loop-homeobox [Caudoviricetes sp.]
MFHRFAEQRKFNKLNCTDTKKPRYRGVLFRS